MNHWKASLGANYVGYATDFRVWAPEAATVAVILEGGDPVAHSMARAPDGYFGVSVPGVAPGALYRYSVDGKGPFPDPASRYQPEGVHGPSQVVDPSAFEWTDDRWHGVARANLTIYELHTGTFTSEGTFAAVQEKLPYLRDLGITALELMPVADFPGRWNWGYDGVDLFAPARCYGTPDDLRRLVDAAHRTGLAVLLDVVYNHFGPDGAYQGVFSRYYYSTAHRSPWGDGINLDGENSEPVRDYLIENALRWIHEYHLDGLRLDATHALVDEGPRHILASLAGAVRASLAEIPRRVHIIAEDVRNLGSMVSPESEGGWGLDAVWSDDFHHQVRVMLAGDRDGYFQDFRGDAPSLAETARKGWYYSGQHAPYFGGPRGTEPKDVAYSRFICFIQNHDQIGNRAFGERLHHQIELAAWRAASALLLLLPEVPLLFMGQEWASSAPFLFFTDHHEELGRLVTDGRRREFRNFAAFADPDKRALIPDPQAQSTFEASRLSWDEVEREPHASVLRLYQNLFAFRRTLTPGGVSGDLQIEASGNDGLAFSRRTAAGDTVLAVVRLRGAGTVDFSRFGLQPWTIALTTEDRAFATDPEPPEVDRGFANFRRPGAVVLTRKEDRHAGPAA